MNGPNSWKQENRARGDSEKDVSSTLHLSLSVSLSHLISPFLEFYTGYTGCINYYINYNFVCDSEKLRVKIGL